MEITPDQKKRETQVNTHQELALAKKQVANPPLNFQ
jgi:hypothetical protein